MDQFRSLQKGWTIYASRSKKRPRRQLTDKEGGVVERYDESSQRETPPLKENLRSGKENIESNRNVGIHNHVKKIWHVAERVTGRAARRAHEPANPSTNRQRHRATRHRPQNGLARSCEETKMGTHVARKNNAWVQKSRERM